MRCRAYSRPAQEPDGIRCPPASPASHDSTRRSRSAACLSAGARLSVQPPAPLSREPRLRCRIHGEVVVAKFIYLLQHGLSHITKVVPTHHAYAYASCIPRCGIYSKPITEASSLLEHNQNGECSALGFLDSGLTVFASTLPRPARRGHVAPGRGFDSGTSLASTARCTSA